MNTLESPQIQSEGTIFDDADIEQRNPQEYAQQYESSVFNDSEDEQQFHEDPLESTLNPSEEDFERPINENPMEKYFEQLKAKEKSEQDYKSQSYLGKLWQNVSGLGVRGAEAALGIPGELKSFADFMLVDLPEQIETKLSGKDYNLPSGYRKLITGNPLKPDQEGYEEYEEQRPGLKFPTSEKIRETITKPLSGEYFEPKDKDQKFYQDTVQDIVRMFAPGSSANRFTRLSPVSKLTIPIYANMGKEISKDLGFSPTTQEFVKMGVMFGMDLHGRAQTRRYAGDLINRAENMVHPGHMMDARYIEHRLNQVERNLRRGGTSPATTRALQTIQEVRDRIQNGQIETADLMAFRRRLNDVISSGGGFDVPGAARPAWTANMQRVKNRIISSVDRELRRSNPEAARLWREGNQAYAVFSRSTAVGNWMRNQVQRNPIVSNTLKLLMGPASYHAGESILKNLPKAAAVALPTYGAIKAYQITTRAMRSPVVRRYYNQVINAALRENSLLFNESLKKLDKAFREQEAIDPLLNDLAKDQ